ncbi:MAG: PEP-CTERM sorting domain-containing protein [Thermoguttaceae bacterium]
MRTTITTAFAMCAFLAFTALANADVMPFNYTKSFDGQNARLYNIFNGVFDTSLNGNKPLWETYGMANPGTIQANDARVYGLGGIWGEASNFEIFGDTTSDVYSTSSLGQISSVNSLKQFYNNQPLFNDPAYTGSLNFSISNSNGKFYSNINDFANMSYLWTEFDDDANVNHFMYFDVTSLMESVFPNLNFGYTSAYLVAYEDRLYDKGRNVNWDGDYNDGMFLVFNNAGATATPEPATLLILGLGGLVGLPLVTRRSRKNAA